MGFKLPKLHATVTVFISAYTPKRVCKMPDVIDR